MSIGVRHNVTPISHSSNRICTCRTETAGLHGAAPMLCRHVEPVGRLCTFWSQVTMQTLTLMCLLRVHRCGTCIRIPGLTFSSPAISSRAFSSPILSTPAFLFLHFPVLNFPVPHFPVLHFGPSNLTSLVPYFPVLHFQRPHL